LIEIREAGPLDPLQGRCSMEIKESGVEPFIPSIKRWSIFALYLGYDGETERVKWGRRCLIAVREAGPLNPLQ